MDNQQDFWGGKRTIPAIGAGIARIRWNIGTMVAYQVLGAILLLVSLFVFLGTLPSADASDSGLRLGVSGALLVIIALWILAFEMAIWAVADLGDAAGEKLGLRTIGAQALKTSGWMLTYMPFVPVALLPTYVFARYIIVDQNVGPLTALKRSARLSGNGQWKKNLKLQAADALSDLAGGSILAAATQAGVEIALGGRYLELKRLLSGQDLPAQ